MICKPKDKGGLGITNFRHKNDVLLMKFVHKFYNKDDTPWVQLLWNAYYDDQVPHAVVSCGSFWWRDVMKLGEKYREIASPEIHCGSTVLFWKDKWEIGLSRTPLQERMAHLFSFAKDESCSVRDMAMSTDLLTQFHLPLSERAYVEFKELKLWLTGVQLSQGNGI